VTLRALGTLRVVAALALLAACGDGGTGTSPTTAPGGATTSPTTAGSATTTSAPLPGAATTPTSVAGTGPGPVALLRDVRAARQEGFDRIVFEFEGTTLPGAEVRYVERPVLEDGSGNEVTVAGEAVLQVRMRPASGVDLSGATFREAYTGPRRFGPSGTAVVQEVVRTGDFEAVLTWVAGLQARAPFLVSTLADPPRLVVDVRA
jgi:hypothetical protein